MRPIVTCVILAATSIAACAGNPQPGEPGYPYNLTGRYQVEFLVDGTPYRGVMDLTTAPGGVVSGSFTVTDPAQVDGTVEGGIVADTVDFQMPYEIQENGCMGVVHGRSAIADGGEAFGGAIRLDDSCGGEMAGTLEVQR
jgi:nitrous oxidase accessory protein NosD